MADDDCKYIIDEIVSIDPDIKREFWEDVSEQLGAISKEAGEPSAEEMELLLKSISEDFRDRAKRLKLSRAIIRHNRNLLESELEFNAEKFIKNVALRIETQRDIFRMQGEHLIRQRIEDMSDGGLAFKSGALDEELYKYAAVKEKNPDARVKASPDVEKAYQLMKEFDKWDYEVQVMNGVSIEKLTGHLLKYSNSRARLMELESPSIWINAQMRLRDLPATYGPKAHMAEQLLEEEYQRIVDKTITNSIRPNRLMYRGVVLKPGAVIEHNRLFGDGTAYDSMLRTLRRTANDTALQKLIPVDRGLQRGVDVKNPDAVLDAIANRGIDPKAEWELIEKIQSAVDNDVSPHIRELNKRMEDHLKELERRYNNLGPNASEKQKLEMDKQIRFLKQESNRTRLESKLDGFIGRDLSVSDYTQLDDVVSQIIDTSTTWLTSPLLLKGSIASTFDAVPKLARLMEIYDDENPVKLMFESLKAVFYTTGVTKKGEVIPGARARAAEIEDMLGFMITQEQALYDLLGIDKSLDGIRSVDRKRSPLGFMNEIANLSFSLNGIGHQNRSSFNGSIWIELRALRKALKGEMSSDSAARLFAEYGLSENDIFLLKSQAMTDNLMDISRVRVQDPVLYDKMLTGMVNNAFEMTPRADARVDDLLDKTGLFGTKPKRSESKTRRSSNNARRALIRTGMAFVLNTHEILARSLSNDPIKRKNQILKRTMALVGLASFIAGMKQVLYDFMKVGTEKGGTNMADPEVFIGSFMKGATSFEYLGIFRDATMNLVSGNWYSAAENFMGPVYSVYADVGYHGYKISRKGLDHWAGVQDWDEVPDPSMAGKLRKGMKRATPILNIPILEAVTDELIVEAIIGSMFPESLEMWKEQKAEREEDELENWRNVGRSGDYFKDYYKYRRGKEVD
jgi:hypothetical protein